ncbi:MarR family winged helix-turn-helix transcriptional regulator [Streptomonospora sp. S1-112]|uniref:MarR family winged helix-turn-helix transcriptional regulator n=1 Tax=Streptomonospora mangrovi TaxID=2883123 RepID=A0A9X3SI18_9ACTN|nr:MarR family winged helix-turn-helix transcriptional regulator [Streptomonospora mangrovi]MDA0565844.1 MarR family winged helix-turn-helix transcriptional regulator [Streptomonospora mangrovi]
MPDTEGPGQTLFHFVRYWSRRWLSPTGAGIGPDRGRDVWVTEAVAARAQGSGATVNDVADELGIDQSGASRLVAQAVAHGYLRKTTSADDARRRILVVTDSGRRLLSAAHAWQESVFADLTADWPERDVRELHRMMRRLIAHPQANPQSEPPFDPPGAPPVGGPARP